MKKLSKDNKGFTLVEMIVVLVILAILAAILIPGLLGYIDDAKNKQIEIHGKAVYTAAQAVASKYYGKTNKVPASYSSEYAKDVRDLAELSTFSNSSAAKVQFKGSSGPDAYKVIGVEYTEDGSTWYQFTTSPKEWKKVGSESGDVSSLSGNTVDVNHS